MNDRDRRKHFRITVALPLTFTTQDLEESKVATTKDLSSGGLCFLTESRVEPGEELRVEFELGDKTVVSAAFKVLRVYRVVGVFVAGGEFRQLAPSAEDALLEFSRREEARQNQTN